MKDIILNYYGLKVKMFLISTLEIHECELMNKKIQKTWIKPFALCVLYVYIYAL
jgi:hypothetical protein